MTTYAVIATRGGGSCLVVAKSRPRTIGIGFNGYVYDKKLRKLTPVGAEIFSRGYWEESSEQIDVGDVKVSR